MKLFASPTSPYARLVRVVLLEKELTSRIEMVWVDPWQSSDTLLAINPLSRIPVLVDEDGVGLSESAVIVLYLERRFPEPRLMPLDRVEHVHQKLGLAQGLMDVVAGVVVHRRFHGESDGDPLVERRLKALGRTLPRMDETVQPVRDRPDLGSYAIAVALDFLDFRLPEIDWRGQTRQLPGWFETMAARASLTETRPQIAQPTN